MKKIQIQTGKDNEILRKISEPVLDLSKKTSLLELSLSDFVKAMQKDLNNERGFGIAAPQVGENIRVILTRLNPGTEKEILFAMVNPEITWKSWDGDIKVTLGVDKDDIVVPNGAAVDEEGCLSLPGYYANVVRAEEISVDFFDGRGLLKKNLKGKASTLDRMTLNLKGLNARIVQHEVDHLNGILICDRIG